MSWSLFILSCSSRGPWGSHTAEVGCPRLSAPQSRGCLVSDTQHLHVRGCSRPLCEGLGTSRSFRQRQTREKTLSLLGPDTLGWYGRSPFYLFIFEFVFIGPATVQPRLAHETCHMGTYRRGKDMGAHPQRQHDLHMPFPIHVQLA